MPGCDLSPCAYNSSVYLYLYLYCVGTSQPELKPGAGEDAIAEMDRILYNKGDIPTSSMGEREAGG